jgi:hypothetical protein
MLHVHVDESDALMIARPRGTLDVEMASEIVDFVEIKELQIETGFNRFCDLTLLDGIRLSYAEIIQLAARRRKFNPNDIAVKSVFLAINPLSFGIARMYEQILGSPRIEVSVWSDPQAAADWLGVKLDRLTRAC